MEHTAECRERTARQLAELEKFYREYPNFCSVCWGAGGKTEYGGRITPDWFEPCDFCVGQGICPKCGWWHGEEWSADVCGACGWTWEGGFSAPSVPDENDCDCFRVEPSFDEIEWLFEGRDALSDGQDDQIEALQ